MTALGQAWGDARAIEEIYTVMAEPVHAGARLLFDDWRRHNADGGFVVGVHVPSRALSPVLAGLSLYEPLRGGLDFRVRLAGTALRRRFGRDIAGLKLSELFDDIQFEHHRGQMNRVTATGTPYVLDVRGMRSGRMRLHFELLGLKVFAADCETPWIMTGQFFYDP